MIMDMDVLAESVPASRAASPPPNTSQRNGLIEEEELGSTKLKSPDVVEEKVVEEPPKKMGNLMKELKQDVTQGAMEFNMDSFF